MMDVEAYKTISRFYSSYSYYTGVCVILNSKHLKVCVDRLMNELDSHSSGSRPADGYEIDFKFVEADPGKGQMVDAIIISGQVERVRGSGTSAEEVTTTITIEVYNKADQEEPRATKVETYKVKREY